MRTRPQLQILRAVIQTVTVPMMNFFAALEPTTQHFLHHKTMNADVSAPSITSNAAPGVALRVDNFSWLRKS